jgi:glycosyltransferase involved in cell wall biosynthesis
VIRVGFIVGDMSAAWLGGVNYYRALLSALVFPEQHTVEPVVFVASKHLAEARSVFPTLECIPSDFFHNRSISGLMYRLAGRSSVTRSLFLEPMLARHGINVLSHYDPLRENSRVRSIAWIPDFQHVHLPHFFNSRERRRRDAHFRSIIRESERVIVSSESARQDLQRFEPSLASKARVLRFVPDINFLSALGSLNALHDRYRFNGPYFYLPNQFWVHKNHMLVVKALAVLKQQGITPTVLMTGRTSDYRNPGFFDTLMKEVRRLDLQESFRVLGVVPYSDLMALMHHALAVINPSLFEGWSSTVEEAKALGKCVLLSDLDVHKEQDPEHAIFFKRDDAGQLAAAMYQLLNAQPSTRNLVDFSTLSTAHNARRRLFAETYREIVIEVS